MISKCCLTQRLYQCLVVLFLATIATGCCIDPVTGERYFCTGDMSDQEESAWGRQLAPSFVAQSGGNYPDPELHAYLNDIVIGMAKESHRPDLDWTFRILNTSALNAFALPGGQVFVTRGMLAHVETEAQFAHLMGHEIGHVSHRHAMKGQGRETLRQILVAGVGLLESASTEEEDAPLLVTGLVDKGSQVFSLKYSREQELESDQRGIDYAIQAGYDAREANKTFETFLRVKQEQGQSEDIVAALFSTHPLDSTRIRQIDQYLEAQYPAVISGQRELTKNHPNWQTYRDRIRSTQKIYAGYDKALALIESARSQGDQQSLDKAEGLLRRGARKLPTHAPFYVALGAIGLERYDYSSALAHLNRAVELDPAHFEALYLRSSAYRGSKNYRQAYDDMYAAHRQFPSHPVAAYYLGDLSEKLGKENDAATWFKKAAELSPADSEVHKKARQRLGALRQ